MRTKVTLVLIFLNIALFFYIFYVRGLDPVNPDTKNRVLGPETANIQSLEISAADPATSVRLERRGDNWFLTRPLDWPANEFAVKRIVNELQFLKHETSFAVRDLGQTGQTLADYGLEKPALTVTFTPAPAGPGSPQPKQVVLNIGDATKVGNRLYVLSPDRERVHVVSRSLAESLTLRLEDLRADTLFSIPVFEVRSFNLQTAAPANLKIRLRNENNRWSFETPIVARASKTETVLAINSLNSLRVKSFLDPRETDASRTGLASPTLQVTLEGNNRRETLLLGSPVETPTPATPAPTANPGDPASPPVEYYAKMDDKTPVFIVAIPATLLETLRTAQENLRDPRVLDLDPATVTAVSLVAPNQPELTLQRLESSTPNPATATWQGVRRTGGQGPRTFPADREAVDQLLQKLSMLSAERFGTAERFVNDAPSAADLENYGFNRPEREITLSVNPQQGASSNTLPSITLQIGVGAGANPPIYARLVNQPFVYRVPGDIIIDTPVNPLAYRERVLRELPAGAQISAVKLTDLSNDAVLIDTTLPVGTENVGVNTPAAREAIEALAAQLRLLRAKSFVREEFSRTVSVSGEERGWRYRLDTTITLTGGADAQTVTSALYFSERAGGNTQFVGSPEFNLVFEAEQPLLDAFFALTYGPRDPGPTPPPTQPSPTPDAPPAQTP